MRKEFILYDENEIRYTFEDPYIMFNWIKENKPKTTTVYIKRYQEKILWKMAPKIDYHLILKAFRFYRGISFEKMDELLGVARNGYQRYELKQADCYFLKLVEICKILNIDLSVFNIIK